MTTRTATGRGGTDIEDERLIRDIGVRGIAAGFARRVRGGDLGALPVVIGLILIWAVFQFLNPNFLSANNLVNLTLQCAAVGTIALGVVVVLLVGQIDLSVGSVSGLAAAILGVTFAQSGWPLPLAIITALAVGPAVGLFYTLLFNRFGVPSFVITLGGLLGILGLQLAVLGTNTSINIPYGSWIVTFAQSTFLAPWMAYTLAALASLGVFFSGWRRSIRRREAELSTRPLTMDIVKASALFVAMALAIAYLATDRGVGVMFVFFVALVVLMDFLLKRTRWGRSVYAVGGSVEAARRAGIRVARVYMSAFIICSTLAALGGILAAGRLASAAATSGAGDTNLNAIAAAVIGGTSLFGGRGSAWSALLGILVIQSISSGLTLMNLNSAVRFIITGAVLLLAVVIDSLSRRSRASHGTG